jgi:hypothetical protein
MLKKILIAHRGVHAGARGNAHLRSRMCSVHHGAAGAAAKSDAAPAPSAAAELPCTRSARGD